MYCPRIALLRGHYVSLLLMVGFSVYAILQLASSLKALSSVATNRDRFLRQDVLAGR